MLLVCKKHMKEGVQCLHTPHVTQIKSDSFQGTCSFCTTTAQYKLFYSIPVSTEHRISIKEILKKKAQ